MTGPIDLTEQFENLLDQNKFLLEEVYNILKNHYTKEDENELSIL